MMMETVPKKEKKSGRPTKPIRKEIRASVRFTSYEYFIIKEKSAAAGVSISQYLRQLAINASLKGRLTAEEIKFVRHLVGMSTNINQVAKVCHREGLFQAMLYFENYRSEMDRILQKLKS